MGNEPWLIKNSTKEERQKRINGAIAIQSTGGVINISDKTHAKTKIGYKLKFSSTLNQL